MSTPNDNASGYEPQDVNTRPIVLFALGLLAALAVVLVLSHQLTARLTPETSPPHPMADSRPSPAGPILQAHPSEDWEQYRAAQTRRLESYGWIDRSQERVHIPIEAAMELLLQRGVPHRESGEPPR